MGVTAYGAEGNKPDVAGTIEQLAEPIRSIFDLGSEPVGSEHEPDSTTSDDASADRGFGSTAFDPSSVTPNDSGDREAPYGRTPTGRVRKRPVGSGGAGTGGGNRGGGNTTRKTATEVSTFVADLLYGLHEMAANFTNTEELSLDEDEAKALGEATVRVAQEYDMPMPDAKTMAWVNLAKVLSVVYGPRVGAIRMRKAQERRNRPQPIRAAV